MKSRKSRSLEKIVKKDQSWNFDDFASSTTSRVQNVGEKWHETLNDIQSLLNTTDWQQVTLNSLLGLKKVLSELP